MGKPNIKQFDGFVKKAEDRIGRSIRQTTGGDSANHSEGALDIGAGWSNKLTHKEFLIIGLTASEFGFRIGDERHPASPHLHVDNRRNRDGSLESNFERESFKPDITK